MADVKLEWRDARALLLSPEAQQAVDAKGAEIAAAANADGHGEYEYKPGTRADRRAHGAVFTAGAHARNAVNLDPTILTRYAQ